jgi:uncharacterized protein
MQWYNCPPSWQKKESIITVTAGAKSDFWRKTHYGFIRDDGNFYYREIRGNFLAQVKVTGQYKSLYDQAGLMLRLDEQTWLKCGIEYLEGIQHASAVVTRDYSDWSVVPLAQNPPSLWLRLKRENEAVEISYSLDGDRYEMLRLAYLTESENLQVGLICASPQGEGFEVSFEEFKISAL